jgi:hypothetical protein
MWKEYNKTKDHEEKEIGEFYRLSNRMTVMDTLPASPNLLPATLSSALSFSFGRLLYLQLHSPPYIRFRMQDTTSSFFLTLLLHSLAFLRN